MFCTTYKLGHKRKNGTVTGKNPVSGRRELVEAVAWALGADCGEPQLANNDQLAPCFPCDDDAVLLTAGIHNVFTVPEMNRSETPPLGFHCICFQ